MLASESSRSPAIDRWKAAAYDLALEEGLAALSTRAVASRVGGSASAINYHFGNREQLIAAVCAQALEASQGWRAHHREETSVKLPIWLDLAGAFATLLQIRIEDGRPLLSLLRELEQEAVASDWPDVAAAIVDEMAAEAAFWQDYTAMFGASPEQGALWADLALALSSTTLSISTSALRSAWIVGAAVRLQQRLAGQSIVLIPSRMQEAAQFDASSDRYNETALRILDIALSALAEKGADRLNQRDVAARAGVSLSAVTYFFGSKQELISAAFEELCSRAYRAMTDEGRERSRAEMVESLSAAEGSTSLTTLDVLMRSGMRHPVLGPVVDRMLAIRGVGSEALLAQLGFAVDRLDGYLWISMVTGRHRRVSHLPAADRKEAMLQAAWFRLEALFAR
ncbi:helix-turn-helix domain-containing protein [Novosphingobium terrae]|uniref:helix-turn-helix domain-containing protein n=1 Tax=Novosphingobium terrae TaxID=2726189 RepID=UPI00197E26FF|nr:helix-turn-helix domain-containing protein [Novosphingobium terrae]